VGGQFLTRNPSAAAATSYSGEQFPAPLPRISTAAAMSGQRRGSASSAAGSELEEAWKRLLLGDGARKEAAGVKQ
jgi:hypothetical protein